MYVVEGYSEGAEGGVVEAGLLPVPKKPPKGIKTDVTKLRLGGGQVWQDHSLEDWDPSEYRDGHTHTQRLTVVYYSWCTRLKQEKPVCAVVEM